MARNRNLASSIISALIGCTFATIACLVFFYFFGKSGTPANAEPPQAPAATPAPTAPQEIPEPEIKAADVKSVGINTVYKGYFEPGNKCAKTYNEYFGNSDGSWSASSPCTLRITLDKDGRATRSIEISRWDPAAKQKRVVEKSESTAAVTPEQFDAIVQAIVTNEAFKAWREGTMINISNCSVTVNHTGGVKSVMSNVDEKSTAFLPMVEAFKKLEKQLTWKAT